MSKVELGGSDGSVDRGANAETPCVFTIGHGTVFPAIAMASCVFTLMLVGEKTQDMVYEPRRTEVLRPTSRLKVNESKLITRDPVIQRACYSADRC